VAHSKLPAPLQLTWFSPAAIRKHAFPGLFNVIHRVEWVAAAVDQGGELIKSVEGQFYFFWHCILPQNAIQFHTCDYGFLSSWSSLC
jgi:hypothetical protein